MRESCLYCVSKHVSQAVVLLMEAPQGYPSHRWLAIGHLGEAADESILEYPEISKKIRDVRLRLMDQEPGFKPTSLMDLMEEVTSFAAGQGITSNSEFFIKYMGQKPVPF